MSRILLAFRAFFAILFDRPLPKEIKPAAPPRPAAPSAPNPAHALQLLAILQRDSRLLDFLMEDISTFDDDQIGAAVRSLHDQARDSLARYLSLQPVIDGFVYKVDVTMPASQLPCAEDYSANQPETGFPVTLSYNGLPVGPLYVPAAGSPVTNNPVPVIVWVTQ